MWISARTAVFGCAVLALALVGAAVYPLLPVTPGSHQSSLSAFAASATRVRAQRMFPMEAQLPPTAAVDASSHRIGAGPTMEPTPAESNQLLSWVSRARVTSGSLSAPPDVVIRFAGPTGHRDVFLSSADDSVVVDDGAGRRALLQPKATDHSMKQLARELLVQIPEKAS